MIHLDTNFVIRGFTPGTAEDTTLRAWLGAGWHIQVSSPAWAEFLCGPVDAAVVRAAEAALGSPLALAAERFNVAGRRRGVMVDCMIAAVAVRHGAELATVNTADFARFAPRGLRLMQP